MTVGGVGRAEIPATKETPNADIRKTDTQRASEQKRSREAVETTSQNTEKSNDSPFAEIQQRIAGGSGWQGADLGQNRGENTVFETAPIIMRGGAGENTATWQPSSDVVAGSRDLVRIASELANGDADTVKSALHRLAAYSASPTCRSNLYFPSNLMSELRNKIQSGDISEQRSAAHVVKNLAVSRSTLATVKQSRGLMETMCNCVASEDPQIRLSAAAFFHEAGVVKNRKVFPVKEFGEIPHLFSNLVNCSLVPEAECQEAALGAIAALGRNIDNLLGFIEQGDLIDRHISHIGRSSGTEADAHKALLWGVISVLSNHSHGDDESSSTARTQIVKIADSPVVKQGIAALLDSPDQTVKDTAAGAIGKLVAVPEAATQLLDQDQILPRLERNLETTHVSNKAGMQEIIDTLHAASNR